MRATVLDRTIVSRDPAYHGWATVARRRDGELLIACSGRREAHVCPFGRVMLLRSSDGGSTWSWGESLTGTHLDDRDAGVLETSRGTLLVNWFSSLAWMDYLFRQETGIVDWLTPAVQRRWRMRRDWLAENVRVPDELGDWLVRSEDGGRTWSPRIPTLVNSPHGPIERADGSLLYAGKRTAPASARTRGSPHESQGAAVAVSHDDGRTWTLTAEIPCAPGHKPADYHELHAVECPGGRLVAQIRNHGEPWKGESIQTESDDGGKSWSVPHSIGVWGLPSHLLRLRDGRLLMTYGHRRAPFGNQARISDDAGKTWSDPLVLSDDGAGADLGYPSTAELDDGTLVSVWYEALPGKPLAVLRQARWRLDGR